MSKSVVVPKAPLASIRVNSVRNDDPDILTPISRSELF